MYKFTNGIVVFDEETRDKYIKAGMHLITSKKEHKDGRINDRTIQEKHTTNNRKTGKHKK